MPVDREHILPQLHYGMDHDHYDWNPLNENRAILKWPNDARIAVSVIVNLEQMEWAQPEDGYRSPTLASGPGPYPDITAWSGREYGHRVGIFRVLDVLDKHGIKPTVAMDTLTAENYPWLVKHHVDRGDEFIGHGISLSRMITSRMSEQEERDYIQTCLTSLNRATGATPMGWLGPEFGESARTPQLLAEAGVRYVCDWTNDDQPFPMKTPQGELYALPVNMPLDDVSALVDRNLGMTRYVQIIKDAFDVLYQEGGRNGRLLVLNLHPFLIGQAFRIRGLDEALNYISHRDGVWVATGSEIIDWYRSNLPVA